MIHQSRDYNRHDIGAEIVGNLDESFKSARRTDLDIILRYQGLTLLSNVKPLCAIGIVISTAEKFS